MYPAVPRRTERTRHQVNYIQPALSDELIEDEETMQDDDGNGEDEVTRCVCDTTEPSEYMIQCESCEVWQHCECIGITRKNTPKHYYCEECRPINHIVYRLGVLKNQVPPRASTTTGVNSSTSSSTSSRSNSSAGATAVGPSPRKRNTNNSREAALFPASSSQRANSPQTDRQNSPEVKPSSTTTKRKRGSQDDSTESTNTKRKRSNEGTNRNGQSGASKSPTPETDALVNQSPQDPTIDSSNNTESKVPADTDSISPTGTTTRKSKAVSIKRKRDNAEGSVEPSSEPPQRRARTQDPSQDPTNPEATQQPESRAGTPSAAAPPAPAPTTSERTTNGKRTANNDTNTTAGKKGRKDAQPTRSTGNHRGTKSRRGNHNGHSGRGRKDTESSPTNGHRARRERSTSPTFKPREPNPRATIAEMKKRLKTISDYIARVQIVTAAQDGSRKSASKSPAVSATSDEKVEAGANGQAQMAENGGQVEETSMSVLDRLSYHIHQFQNKYADKVGLAGGVGQLNGASAVVVGN